MTHKVIMTRQRVIEEKVVTSVIVPDRANAIAASNFQLNSGLIGWKYNKTVDTTEPEIEVIPIHNKEGNNG